MREMKEKTAEWTCCRGRDGAWRELAVQGKGKEVAAREEKHAEISARDRDIHPGVNAFGAGKQQKV